MVFGDRPSEDVDLVNLPTFTIDPCVRPFIHVSGVATKCLKAESTFEVNVEQYISCVRSDLSTEKAGGNRLKPITSFLCHIPDSPKYRNWRSKPMPTDNRWVSILGFLRMDRSGNNLEVERFRIDIDNIVICGQYVPLVTSAASSSVQQNCESTLFHLTAD